MDAVRLGGSEAELVAVGHPYISALFNKYLPVSSDDAVISTAQLAVSESEAIGSKSTDACHDYLYFQPDFASIILSENLSTDAQQRNLAITIAVIETGSSDPQPTPTEAQASKLLNVVGSKLLKRYPASDIAALYDRRAAAANHRNACRMMDALLREVLTLPKMDAAQLLRYLSAQ